MRNGNNTNSTQSILILNIADSNIYIESNNQLNDKMDKKTYRIVSKSKESISAYEVPTFGDKFSISSITLSTEEKIATEVTVNPYGASVTLYSCFRK